MNKETEIKLRVSRETLAALRDHPLLKKRNKSGWQRCELFNQYFDTPSRDLAGARVALRLRRDGEQVIQTLKSRGQSVAGLSERNEWDWYLKKAKLDTKLLNDDCWPASLAELDKKSLQPIFTTDFVREKAEIAWGRGKAKTVIEAALDLGKVIAGEGEEEICELAADLPLMPCDISKAERGYRLFDSGSYGLALPLPALTAEMALDDAIAAIAWHLLGSSQRLAEQYRWNGHWKLLEQWLQQLIDLRALLGSLGQAAPRASSRELREALDALLADWRPRLAAGRDDEALRRNAPAMFAGELQGNRWGLLSLQLSRWLLQRGWTVGRNARGERQGKAPLGNWLPTLLAEEAEGLRLKHYQQFPEALAEQLPRIERLLAWLRMARQVPELPELDRLYGELAKLEALASCANDAEVLVARQAQAHTVATLKPWKLLLK